jgi:hypothetical protein
LYSTKSTKSEDYIQAFVQWYGIHSSLSFVRMFKNEQSSPTLLKRISEPNWD